MNNDDRELSASEAQAVQQLRKDDAVQRHLTIFRGASCGMQLTMARIYALVNEATGGMSAGEKGKVVNALVTAEQQRTEEVLKRGGLGGVLSAWKEADAVLTRLATAAIERVAQEDRQLLLRGVPCPLVPSGKLRIADTLLFAGQPEAALVMLRMWHRWSMDQAIPFTLFKNTAEAYDTPTVMAEYPPEWWHNAGKSVERFKDIFTTERVLGMFAVVTDVMRLDLSGVYAVRRAKCLRLLTRAAKRTNAAMVSFYIGSDTVPPRKGVTIIKMELRRGIDGTMAMYLDNERCPEDYGAVRELYPLEQAKADNGNV